VTSGLDAHIRRRFRALLLRQWKRKRTIARRLIQRGLKPKAAWRVYHQGRRSWWALSHFSPVGRGLRNAYFAECRLVSLVEQWKELQARAVIAPVQLTLALG
jgi:RNA-directed DNA polymerase